MLYNYILALLQYKYIAYFWIIYVEIYIFKEYNILTIILITGSKLLKNNFFININKQMLRF